MSEIGSSPTERGWNQYRVLKWRRLQEKKSAPEFTKFSLRAFGNNISFVTKMRIGNVYSLFVCVPGGNTWSCPSSVWPSPLQFLSLGERVPLGLVCGTPYPRQDSEYLLRRGRHAPLGHARGLSYNVDYKFDLKQERNLLKFYQKRKTTPFRYGTANQLIQHQFELYLKIVSLN